MNNEETRRRHTALPWSEHVFGKNEPPYAATTADGREIVCCRRTLGSGNKVIAEIKMRVDADGGYPVVDDVEEMEANLAFIIKACNNYYGPSAVEGRRSA